MTTINPVTVKEKSYEIVLSSYESDIKQFRKSILIVESDVNEHFE